MVEALKKSVQSFVLQIMFLLPLLIAMEHSYAEQLIDPTRPPDVLRASSSGAATTGPVLQSVLISPQRKMAIISGKTLKLGEKFGKSQLVSITETEVVLQNGKEVQTLKLFPDVQKRLNSNGASAKSDRRQQ
jgi:MSHA biogenesis protein MshK